MKKFLYINMVLILLVGSLSAQISEHANLTKEDMAPFEPSGLVTENIFKTNATVKSELSTLWTAVTLNMMTADILSLYIPEAMVEFTDLADGKEAEIMAGAAVMYQIPISMVLLSKLLPYKANRRANMIAAGLMSAAVIGGGSTDPHYLICGGVEVLTMSFIMWKAWKWSDSDGMLIGEKHNLGLNLNAAKKAYGLTYTYNFR